MIRFKKFDKDKRGTIRYWFWHCLAFNVTAIRLGRWKPKYIFHDMEKPILMLLTGGDYQAVRNWHREHNRHHLSYKGHLERDWEAMAIDWECSNLTKNACPMKFMDKLYNMRTVKGLTDNAYLSLIYYGTRIGLCNPTQAISHVIRTEQVNEYGGPVVDKDED